MYLHFSFCGNGFFEKFKYYVFSVAANRAVSISKNGHTWIIGKVRIRDCYRIKNLKKKLKEKVVLL